MAAQGRIYKEFEPSVKWAHEEDSDTILLSLSGFKKEHLRAQLTVTRLLKISGECNLHDNIWNRFVKEFQIPANCETNKITAKLENGILYVKLPKVIIPAEKQSQERPQKNAQQQASQETASTDDLAKQTSRSESAKNAAEAAQQKEKEPNNGKGKSSASADANGIAQRTQEKGESSVAAERGESESEKSEEDESNIDSLYCIPKWLGGATCSVEAGGDKTRSAVNNKQAVVGNLVTKSKMPRKLLNMLLALLGALLFGFYVTNSIRSYKKSEN